MWWLWTYLAMFPPVMPPCCTADYNCDGVRGTADILYILEYWGEPEADVTGDENTTIADLVYLLSKYGTDCPGCTE